MEKTHDTTWKYEIMKEMRKIDLRGRIPVSVENFVKDRLFDVHLTFTLSEKN